MTKLYDKYYDILKHVYNIMNLTDNEELKEFSKKTIINTINQLIEKDNNNKKAYEGILEEFGFEKKDNLELNANENKENIFNKTENVKKETEKNIKDEDIDEYVFNNIYRNENKSLGEEFQNIMRDLINSIKNGEEEDILLNKNKYDKFVNDNKTILDSEKMNEYFRKRYNEYKVQKESVKSHEETPESIKKSNEGENNKDNSVKEEGLKIKNIKRSYNSKLKNKALSLLALIGIGSFNPLLATGIGIGGYYLYKKGIKNAKNLIESNGLKLDENDNLVDSNGKLINEDEIGKLKYNLIKRELTKIDKKGRIDANYKKNKLTSMLLSVPSKMFKSIKNKYEQIKISKENESDEVKDMNKGLGIIK